MKATILKLTIKKAPASEWAQALSEVYESISVDDLILFLEKAPEGVLEFLLDSTEMLLSNKKITTYLFLTRAQVRSELEYLFEKDRYITTDEFLKLALELVKENKISSVDVDTIYEKILIFQEDRVEDLSTLAQLVKLGFIIEKLYDDDRISEEFLIKLIKEDPELALDPGFPLPEKVFEFIIKNFEDEYLKKFVERNSLYNEYWCPRYSYDLSSNGFQYSELEPVAKVGFLTHLYTVTKKDEYKIQNIFSAEEVKALILQMVNSEQEFRIIIRYIALSKPSDEFIKNAYRGLDVNNKRHVDAVKHMCSYELLREAFFGLFEWNQEWLLGISPRALRGIVSSDVASEELKQKAAQAFLNKVVAGEDAVEKVKNLMDFVNNEIQEAKKYR